MDDLRKRLSRLGVTRGSEFKPKPAPAHEARVEAVLDGHALQTPIGELYEVAHTHPAASQRGPRQLADWLAQDARALANISQLAADRLPALNQFVFLDTETTGLGGAGALAFMVGIGYFNAANDFEVRQFFLRHPGEEEALLSLLPGLIPPHSALVTFNGRNFDVPLLATRYTLARQKTALTALPNVDLLHPARRLWQRRLPSCALSALESDILGISRTHADVPGMMIPEMYQRYLQTGDARDMARVFYHNEQDILSMVALAVVLTDAFTQPALPALPVEDRLSLARWYERLDMLADSETAYRLALDEAPNAELRHAALAQFAALLKRLDRRDEVVPLWEYLADLKLDVSGHEELAKHYEWCQGDLNSAMAWTQQGIALAESWRPGIRRVEALSAFAHRRNRLERKLSGRLGETDSDQQIESPEI